jgi:phenylpropionate dioxygenase-like ring-hydroxylating dioxygenase large terminal subunit
MDQTVHMTLETLAPGADLADDAAPHDLRRIDAHPDHWYPVAWSRELKPGKSLATTFAGDPIVLIRPKTGDVFALANRCAHRQIPLSEGIVEGCAVRCGYHGWAYDASGRCVDVPYLGKNKLPNGVRSYPCREAGGLILVFPGNSARAAQIDFPSLGGSANPAYKTRRFGREIACHYSFMHENLMDMNHQFLHRRLMGQMRPRFLGQDTGADWIEARYSFTRDPASRQPLGEAAIFGQRRTAGDGRGDRDVMFIRTEYPYQTLRIRSGDAAPVMDLWICYTPLDREQRRCRVFGLLSIQRPKFRYLLDAAWPILVLFTEGIFREDRAIVEMEQRAHDEQGADRNQEIFPVIKSLRAVLRRNGIANARV